MYTPYRHNNVLLMGGGIDSYAVALKLAVERTEFHLIHIKYNQISWVAENWAIKQQIKFLLTIIKPITYSFDCDLNNIIKGLNPQGSYLFGNKEVSPEINGRNLILFIIAVKQLNQNGTIYLGLDKPYNGAKPFLDCTLEYFEQVKLLINRPDIKIKAPFIDVEKEEVVKWALTVDPLFLDRTVSCWDAKLIDNKITECGICKHCVTKKELRQRIENA